MCGVNGGREGLNDTHRNLSSLLLIVPEHHRQPKCVSTIHDLETHSIVKSVGFTAEYFGVLHLLLQLVQVFLMWKRN